MTEDSPESENEASRVPENTHRSNSGSPPSQPAVDDSNDQIGVPPEPEEIPSKEYDEEELLDFFKKKGTVDILAQLADGPKRFSEIDNALAVSHGTVANRLTDGIKLDLWREYITYPEDGGKIKLYELEPKAEHLATIAKEENISETTERKRKAYEQHETAISNFQNKIKSDE